MKGSTERGLSAEGGNSISRLQGGIPSVFPGLKSMQFLHMPEAVGMK